MRSSSYGGGASAGSSNISDGLNAGRSSNPLNQTISFRTWALCLPRWILSSKTPLAWHLLESFSARWWRPSSSTATMPLPAPYPGCFHGGGPRLSRRRLLRLALQRAMHVAVIVLNRLYLGRFATLDEVEEFATGYHELAPFEFSDDPHLLPPEKFPELVPYRSSDASRLKLVGKGKWLMEKFLDAVLWLPFVEPRFLLHLTMTMCPTLTRSPSLRT